MLRPPPGGMGPGPGTDPGAGRGGDRRGMEPSVHNQGRGGGMFGPGGRGRGRGRGDDFQRFDWGRPDNFSRDEMGGRGAPGPMDR